MSDQPNSNPPPNDPPTLSDVDVGASLQNVQPVSNHNETYQSSLFTTADSLTHLFSIMDAGENPPGFNLPAMSGSTAIANTVTPEFARRRTPITVASALPPTVYRDVDDQGTRNADGTTTPRSLSYIAVQRSILAWLSTSYNFTDEVAPSQLQSWTQSIDPVNHQPTAQEALSLCYYMRQLGFDTYSRLDPAARAVRLFIANPLHLTRNMDTCYWHQTMGSNRIILPTYLAAPGHSHAVDRARRYGHSRHGAISPNVDPHSLTEHVFEEARNSRREIRIRPFTVTTTRARRTSVVPDMSEYERGDPHTGGTQDPNGNNSAIELLDQLTEEVLVMQIRLRNLLDQTIRSIQGRNGFGNEDAEAR